MSVSAVNLLNVATSQNKRIGEQGLPGQQATLSLMLDCPKSGGGSRLGWIAELIGV